MTSFAPTNSETAAPSTLYAPDEDEDAFLLITRQQSLSTIRSEGSALTSTTEEPAHASRYKLQRNWPLLAVAAVDLTTAFVNIVYHPRPPGSTPPTPIDLIRLRTLAISRPLFLILLSLHIHWRRGSVWIIAASVVTLLVVLWEVNEGVQWRRVEGGRRGSRLFIELLGENGVVLVNDMTMRGGWMDLDWRWLHRVSNSEMLSGLVLQTFFATIEYLAFFVPLHLSPFPPQTPSTTAPALQPTYGTNPRPASRFVSRTRRAQVEDAMRTQRATSVRWDEEEVYAGSEETGRGVGESSTLTAGEGGEMSGVEANPWAETIDRQGEPPRTPSPHSSEHNSSGPSIGRYSDEGQSDHDSESDGSISSNEIIDLPPPRSASYRGLHPTDSPARLGAARLDRNESGFASVGGGQRSRSGSEDDVEAVGGLGSNERETVEREALLGMSSTPPRDESRLERGLRKRWVRRARDVFARNRTGSANGGTDGQYGTFDRGS